jgi:hypothetical protein
MAWRPDPCRRPGSFQASGAGAMPERAVAGQRRRRRLEPRWGHVADLQNRSVIGRQLRSGKVSADISLSRRGLGRRPGPRRLPPPTQVASASHASGYIAPRTSATTPASLPGSAGGSASPTRPRGWTSATGLGSWPRCCSSRKRPRPTSPASPLLPALPPGWDEGAFAGLQAPQRSDGRRLLVGGGQRHRSPRRGAAAAGRAELTTEASVPRYVNPAGRTLRR